MATKRKRIFRKRSDSADYLRWKKAWKDIFKSQMETKEHGKYLYGRDFDKMQLEDIKKGTSLYTLQGCRAYFQAKYEVYKDVTAKRYADMAAAKIRELKAKRNKK